MALLRFSPRVLARSVWILVLLTVPVSGVEPVGEHVRGDAGAAQSLKVYASTGSGITQFRSIVGYRKSVTDTNRAQSLPPVAPTAVFKIYPLTEEEQAAFAAILSRARASHDVTIGKSLAHSEFSDTTKIKQIFVQCYPDDAIEFQVYDRQNRKFSPWTSLLCDGVTQFVRAVLASEQPVAPTK